MIYTVYINQHQPDGELGGFGDIFANIGRIGATITPAVVPLIPGISQNVQNAISAGSQILSGFLGSLNNSGQVKGLGAINAFGAQVLAQFDQLQTAAQQGMQRDQIYQLADQLVAVLSNSQYVYQAKKGADAAALTNFKAQAAQRAAQVKQIADSITPTSSQTPATVIIPGSTTTANVPLQGGANQQILIPGATNFFDGNLTTYLLLGGGILLAVWVLKS